MEHFFWRTIATEVGFDQGSCWIWKRYMT